MSKLWTAFALCAAVFGLMDQASAARAAHNKHAPARAAFAAPRQYQAPLNQCRLHWGERPEELAQDRGYEDDLGNEC